MGHDEDQVLDPLQPELGRALALGRLTRGALHELANGSAAIAGLAELTLDELQPGTRAHEHLLLVREAAESEAVLVAAFRELSRDDTSTATLTVRDHAARAAAAVRASAGRHVELAEAYEGEPAVTGAPAHLERLVVHLLLDAYEALPEGGTLRLRVADGETVTIAIESEPLPGSPTGPRGELGLALARSLAGALGGTVERAAAADLARLPSAAAARP